MKELNKSEAQRELNSLLATLSINIKRLREEKNLSQQSLAFYILSDRNLISEIERKCHGNITLLTLVKLAQVLEVEVTDLISP